MRGGIIEGELMNVPPGTALERLETIDAHLRELLEQTPAGN